MYLLQALRTSCHFVNEPYLSSAAFFFFVLPVSCYYSCPICLCSQQQISIWLFLSSAQLAVGVLFQAYSLFATLFSVSFCLCLVIFLGGIETCRRTDRKNGDGTAQMPRQLQKDVFTHRKPAANLPSSPTVKVSSLFS